MSLQTEGSDMTDFRTAPRPEAVDAEGVPLAFRALFTELGLHATAGAVAWLQSHPEVTGSIMSRGVAREVAAEHASSFLAAEFAFEIGPLLLDLLRSESGKLSRHEGLEAARALGELVIRQICEGGADG